MGESSQIEMKKFRYLFIILFLAADQITKSVVRSTFSVGESIPIIKDFFSLTYIQNTGAAFSLFTGKYTMLIILPLAALVFAFWYMESHIKSHWTLTLALVLIIAGGIGNLIDRLRFEYVVDLFNFHFFPAVFNVADVFICVGCGFLILFMFVFEDKERSTEMSGENHGE